MKVIIYGFGRMGLTHFSILNALNPNIFFTVIEPNKILREILKSNINAKFYADDSNLDSPFEICIITTPPSLHLDLVKKSIHRKDKKIFVEKPFGGHSNIKNHISINHKNIYIGYVLRFNPCIQWIKSNINPKNIKSIHGEYISNTIEKKPTGWRNGKFSGVCNEMGSHIIDLILYISEFNDFKILQSKKQSIVSDIDDIVEANIKTDQNILVSLYFNWVKKNVRKPIFKIEIELKDEKKYYIDQQQINIYKKNEFVEKVAVTDLAKTVPYYLRGIDFTNQMVDLLENQNVMASFNEAILVNKVISKILS